jgi:hypothetical protein
VRYEEYQYLYPPRPEHAIPPHMINVYERQGFVAQVKKNGTCSVIAVAPDRSLTCMRRHGPTVPHKLWTPTAASSRMFRRLKGKGWYVFVAELLHSKTPTIKDTNYLFDLLVDDGEYLVGTTFAQRQERLQALMLPLVVSKRPAVMESHYVIDDHLWLARVHTKGLKQLFDSLEKHEDEGIVLKKPNARLDLCFNERANQAWQVKCRKGHKNYGF